MRVKTSSAPRSRAELERLIESINREHGADVKRHNFLVQRLDETNAELAELRPRLVAVANANHDIDWEYFRRLQLDGVVPGIAPVADLVYRNYAEADEDREAALDETGPVL